MHYDRNYWNLSNNYEAFFIFNRWVIYDSNYQKKVIYWWKNAFESNLNWFRREAWLIIFGWKIEIPTIVTTKAPCSPPKKIDYGCCYCCSQLLLSILKSVCKTELFEGGKNSEGKVFLSSSKFQKKNEPKILFTFLKYTFLCSFPTLW